MILIIAKQYLGYIAMQQVFNEYFKIMYIYFITLIVRLISCTHTGVLIHNS